MACVQGEGAGNQQERADFADSVEVSGAERLEKEEGTTPQSPDGDSSPYTGEPLGDELPQSADADSSLGEGAFWKER